MSTLAISYAKDSTNPKLLAHTIGGDVDAMVAPPRSAMPCLAAITTSACGMTESSPASVQSDTRTPFVVAAPMRVTCKIPKQLSCDAMKQQLGLRETRLCLMALC